MVGLGGYVTPTDLYPDDPVHNEQPRRDLLRSAPNLGGADGGGPTSTSVLAGYRNLLVHEITHLVQANAYVLGGSGEKTIWEIEGGATLAEQLVAYDLFGHGPGRNLGHAQVHQSEESRAWYWSGWIADMASFFRVGRLWRWKRPGTRRAGGVHMDRNGRGRKHRAVRGRAGLWRAVHAPPVRHGSLGRRVSRR